MKFKLIKETKEYFGKTLHRIESIKDFNDIKKGEKGGWVEKEGNLSQDENAWVYGNAQVSGNAQVYGNAQVSCDAQVSGNAQVSGDAWVYGDARVYGNAQVSGDAWVYGDARVYGELKLIGGYFYHLKSKTEEIEKVELEDGYELLCSNPKLDETKEESLVGKEVEVKIDEKVYKAVIQEA